MSKQTPDQRRSLLLLRVAAYAADCALLFIVLAPLGFAAQRLLGTAPGTAHAIYVTLLINFSIPAWAYFTWGDQSTGGATAGKHLLLLQARTEGGGRIGVGRAFGRTALKMLPWETTHAAVFLLAPAVGTLGTGSCIGLCAAYALIFAYLIVAWRTGGHRSVHDFAAGTRVGWTAEFPADARAV